MIPESIRLMFTDELFWRDVLIPLGIFLTYGGAAMRVRPKPAPIPDRLTLVYASAKR